MESHPHLATFPQEILIRLPHPHPPGTCGSVNSLTSPDALDSAFAAKGRVRYDSSMSTAVFELKEKLERLTSEERYELMQILEDIEDNALADKAEAEGGWTKLAVLKKELGRA